VCYVSVCTTCAHHVYAAEVSAGLHVLAPCASQTGPLIHSHSDCLPDWSVGRKNYQTDLNHFSSHGVYHRFDCQSVVALCYLLFLSTFGALVHLYL